MWDQWLEAVQTDPVTVSRPERLQADRRGELDPAYALPRDSERTWPPYGAIFDGIEDRGPAEALRRPFSGTR